MQEVHVLNGDALLYKFPDAVLGERLVMRECLIEGPVEADSIDSFFKQRMKFLQMQYGETNVSYEDKAISQFEKLNQLSDETVINLWFEHDLFCQANLWFVCYFLELNKKSNPVFLIMPETFSSYGFGGLSTQELQDLYDKRKPFYNVHEFANLWQFYRFEMDLELMELGRQMSTEYVYLPETIQAHLDRKRKGDSFGRPIESLIGIINDLQTTEFRIVFNEFCVREGIYGYGDSQVKVFFDEVISKKLHDLN